MILAKGSVYRRLDLDQSQEEQPKVRLKLIAVQSSWQQVMAEVAADFIQTIVKGEGSRIRFCDNPDCLWVFYDDTRSRTKKYCDDKMCGNLMKVRRFRERQKKQT
ncbi:CGNR zinc finger domain-containing protein [Paenibacillus massiliensis]|uniref:CGNR zinc finger domain-containing protein n=1 Tax=Paenibacillus massiliensis TaxID=225917 RepID=UPI000376A9F6|nr:CGNR zinc finger domain-containing protein [Paenibacillus massiliensis]